MAWGGLSSVPLGSILYLVFTATESLMTCVRSCENCFQVVCRVGRGTWAEAWVWVGKHKGKGSYRLERGPWRTDELQSTTSQLDWSRAPWRQLGEVFAASPPWQRPCIPVEVDNPKRKAEKDNLGVVWEIIGMRGGWIVRSVNQRAVQVWAWHASQELGSGQASTDTDVLKMVMQEWLEKPKLDLQVL